MTTQSASAQDWARLRFAIVGPLLASPPKPGMLQAELDHLACKDYLHPGTGRPVRFAASTIERWYYKARNHPDNPLRALSRKVPEHAGTHPSISSVLQQALRSQHQAHPSWSYQLHYDNLLALAQDRPELGRVPSRSTIVRHIKQSGLDKQRRKRRNRDAREVVREKRSYEIEHVHGLWHSDFHQGPRHVLTQAGTWQPCYLLAFIDDRWPCSTGRPRPGPSWNIITICTPSWPPRPLRLHSVTRASFVHRRTYRP